MTTGIYGIFDSDTDECLYVGMSKNIEDRWKSHLKLLRNKKHPRKDFVEWFYKNGSKKELLVFRILEECKNKEETLNTLEIKWFSNLAPKYYGKKPSLNEKWILSEETKLRISKSNVESLLQKGILYKAKCAKCNKLFNASQSYHICVNCREETIIITNCVRCNDLIEDQKRGKIYCSEQCQQLKFKENNPDWVAPKSSRFEKMNKEDLNRLYTVENCSIDEICEFFGCKERTVYYHLKNYDIPKRSYIEQNTCDTCGITVKKRTAKNCFKHKYNSSGIKPDSFCIECGKKTFNKSAEYCSDHRSIALRKGAHRQWHVNRGIVKNDCEFCI